MSVARAQLPHIQPSMRDWISDQSEAEAIELVGHTLGDLPVKYGDTQTLLMDMADEFDNWGRPSPHFEKKAGELLWAAFQRMNEFKESEE